MIKYTRKVTTFLMQMLGKKNLKSQRSTRAPNFSTLSEEMALQRQPNFAKAYVIP